MNKALSKTKTTGFSLLEILVTVTIGAILATITVAVVSNNILRANDAVRIQAISNSLTSLQAIDSNILNQNEKYIYSQDDFRRALAETNVALNESILENICFFVGMASGPSALDNDNEVVIATWGKTTSTLRPNLPGVLAVGTPQAVVNITRAGGMDEEFFHCDKPENFDFVHSAFMGDYAP